MSARRAAEPRGIGRRLMDEMVAPNDTYQSGVWMSPLFALASLAILVAGPVCADDEKVVPVFTPASNATLAYASADWQVWIVRDQIDSHRRAPAFRARYYLQEFAKPTATLVFQGQNVSARVITVLPDRTMLLDGSFKPGVSEPLRRGFSVTDGTEFPVTLMRRNEVDFAVKDRVVYTFARPSRRPGEPRPLVIEAVDLASKDGRTTTLLTLPSAHRVGPVHEVDTPRVITKAGIDIWDGKECQRIAWLKPAP
jgi:hypothetical protein